MKPHTFPVVFLPGAGNHPPDLSIFRTAETESIETIYYPGWQTHAASGFSIDGLIADLAAQIEAKVPIGPIRIMGLSLGGHLGYVTALYLQAKGREIGGFCAIDSFMIESAAPSSGWQGRAMAQAIELLRKGRIGELVEFGRSKFWRLLIRVAGARLARVLSHLGSSSHSRSNASFDPILESELSMRMLIRELAPWLASLDSNPTPLHAPAALLRTSATVDDDPAWQRRCPGIDIRQVQGHHHNLFDTENAGCLRDAFIAATCSWVSRSTAAWEPAIFAA